jgi:hypothetical protein
LSTRITAAAVPQRRPVIIYMKHIFTIADQGYLFHYAAPERVIAAIDDVIVRSANKRHDESVNYDRQAAPKDADGVALS